MQHKIKLSQSEVREIFDYFIARNTDYDGRRNNRRDSVMPRRAFANAVSAYADYPRIAGALDVDRTNIYHYTKTHKQNMIYTDYQDLYSDAVVCVAKFIEGNMTSADEGIMVDIKNLRLEVAELKAKLNKMKGIVGKQVRLLAN